MESGRSADYKGTATQDVTTTMRTVRMALKTATHSRKTSPAIQGCGRGAGGVLFWPETMDRGELVIRKYLTKELIKHLLSVVHAGVFFKAFCRNIWGFVVNEAAGAEPTWAQ
ncbi:MAG: hypothetical protein ABJV68_08805 [Paracoccaceae bacterium]